MSCMAKRSHEQEPMRIDSAARSLPILDFSNSSPGFKDDTRRGADHRRTSGDATNVVSQSYWHHRPPSPAVAPGCEGREERCDTSCAGGACGTAVVRSSGMLRAVPCIQRLHLLLLGPTANGDRIDTRSRIAVSAATNPSFRAYAPSCDNASQAGSCLGPRSCMAQVPPSPGCYTIPHQTVAGLIRP